MSNFGLLGRVLLACGICLVLLSIGAFVNRADANCDSCANSALCVAEAAPNCGGTVTPPVPPAPPGPVVYYNCTGGLSCWFTSPCKCKPPLLGGTGPACHCG